MSRSSRIVVRNEHDPSPPQVFREFLSPCTSAPRIRRRNKSEGAQGFYVLLTLQEEDRLGGFGRNQFWKAVKDAATTIEIPDVAPSIWIGPTLLKILRMVAQNLIQ